MDPLKLFVVETVVLMASLGAVLLSNCDDRCCLRLLEKMLVLEGGVELPVVHENEGARRFPVRLECNSLKNITKGRGGSECMFKHFQSNSSSVFVSVEELFKTFKVFLPWCLELCSGQV